MRIFIHFSLHIIQIYSNYLKSTAFSGLYTPVLHASFPYRRLFVGFIFTVF